MTARPTSHPDERHARRLPMARPMVVQVTTCAPRS
jgi:hypothetical protein